mmetsp:Transcript_7341/g.18276  ORF Transcript_7341/g.18276 Transcript_7341/m.18276 type:complete len:135 (+) Transcript_7341:127-531(+)
MAFRVFPLMLLALAAPTVDSNPRPGRMHDLDAAIKGDLHKMMVDEEDGGDLFEQRASNGPRHAELLQVAGNSPTSASAGLTMDGYVKDSEEALSAALGPRWDAKVLDETAKKSTSALLRGISSKRGLGAMLALR